jgi:transcriptional regulator GlxA family with amidase domain
MEYTGVPGPKTLSGCSMALPNAGLTVSPPTRVVREPLRVGVILAEHFTLSAFAVFIDHLRLAADEGDRSRPVHVQWSIMASRQESVPASCGVMIEPTSRFLPPESLDYVIVIGGLLHAGPQIDEATTRYLREVAETRVPLIGICTGSFILCRAGLMRGRRSCVSWYHYQDFLEAFPDHDVVADRLFLADGPRITCAGGAGAAALATHLIERHLGSAVAQKASQVLLFDKPRSGSDAQPHPPLSETVSEPRVRRALLLMEQNLTRPIAIAAVAEELGMSVRQLERLCREHVGLGPASLYRQLRMRYANWLIENTDRSVTEIAIEAGFADCAHFSRQFKDAYGLSPSTRRLQPNRPLSGDVARARVFE